mmetsp:Transcript_51808/g.143448  ORF Transcript_51808/g.143448 Transcript_51808/m.143448 type:complete len:240 (+) Transcript_51808:539-1258(+)
MHLVVAAHERAHTCFHGSFERRIIDLPCCLLVNFRVLFHSVGFLLVECPVLGASNDPSGLHSFNIRGRQPCPKVRVVARHVLEVAAIPGNAMHLDPRAKDHIGPLGTELLADGLCGPAHQAVVPGGRQRQCRGEARGGAEGARTPHRVVAEAVAGVMQLQRWDPQARNARGVAHVHARRENREKVDSGGVGRPARAPHQHVPLVGRHCDEGVVCHSLRLFPRAELHSGRYCQQERGKRD